MSGVAWGHTHVIRGQWILRGLTWLKFLAGVIEVIKQEGEQVEGDVVALDSHSHVAMPFELDHIGPRLNTFSQHYK